jgi:hypothetical protein
MPRYPVSVVSTIFVHSPVADALIASRIFEGPAIKVNYLWEFGVASHCYHGITISHHNFNDQLFELLNYGLVMVQNITLLVLGVVG